jgi:hypothetical protein
MVCATLATLPAHGLAVTVRVGGVFVSNVQNSEEYQRYKEQALGLALQQVSLSARSSSVKR